MVIGVFGEVHPPGSITTGEYWPTEDASVIATFYVHGPATKADWFAYRERAGLPIVSGHERPDALFYFVSTD